MALSPKHAAFVREYLVDLNATQAAIRVGYSPKTAKVQGSRLLTNVAIRSAVDEGRRKATQQADVTVSEILQGLKAEAKGADNASARVAAWSWLGKYAKLFTDKTELSGKDGGPVTISINGVIPE
jgi:phage terminase small subunit